MDSNSSDDISFKTTFTNAEAYVYSRGDFNPISSLLKRQYGDACFIAKHVLYPSTKKEVTFFRNEKAFSDYIPHSPYLSSKSHLLVRNVEAYGSISILMVDDTEKHSDIRDAIADFFKSGNVFDLIEEDSFIGYVVDGQIVPDYRIKERLLKERG